jgi:hypothetical protein
MRKTINQINQELKAIADGMPQIHTYAWKDFLRAYKEEEVNYPLMCAYYPSGALLDNQTDIQLTIVISDKIYKDWSNLNDVESDTLGICRSIFNIINRSTRWQRIGRVLSCNVTKFVERGGDEVAGHTMVFQFRMRDSNSLCDIPIFDYDFDSVYESTCQPVLIFKDGILIDTVPSGGVYEYFSDTCENATVENSDNSYSDTVASGSTLVLPDITVTDSDGTTYTQPSVTDVVCKIPPPCEDATVTVNGQNFGTVASGGSINVGVENTQGTPVGALNINQSWEIQDAILTLNGNTFLSVPSGDTQDIELLDQNGDAITPDDVTGNVITVDIPTDLFWELNFNGTDDVIFIPATVNNVGTLTSQSSSNVGTITISTDGVTYGAFSLPFTPVNGTTYYFKRSTATVNGVLTLIGTY